jgi:two-component system, sensor histidine kinase and response regulator
MHMPCMDGLALGSAIRADPSVANTPLVLLASVGEDVQAEEFAAVLTKPARQSQLLKTIASMLGVASSTGTVPRHASTGVAAEGMGALNGPLVLVAEDMMVNQLVARRMLEKFGCRVDVVGNGREAVAALELIPYAVVMMDIQMPEMDGFEATAEIRRRESTGLRRTPIIAMTANALVGDRERCLAAGMDDYVSKPVRIEELEDAVRRWVMFVDGQSLAA